jgi:hypothetical protein
MFSFSSACVILPSCELKRIYIPVIFTWPFGISLYFKGLMIYLETNKRILPCYQVKDPKKNRSIIFAWENKILTDRMVGEKLCN